MSVELNAAWWKKNKAKTLLTEPLTAALTGHDAAMAKAEVSPTRENMSALLGHLKLVQSAIAQTLAKCNAKLHGETIDYLKKMDAEAKSAATVGNAQMKMFADRLGEFQTRRDATAAAIAAARSAPAVPKFDGAITEANNMLAWMNQFPVGSEEMRATTKYLTTARDLLVSVRELLGTPHGTPEEVAKLREKLIPRFKEIDVTIPKIKTLGGFLEEPRAIQSYAISLK